MTADNRARSSKKTRIFLLKNRSASSRRGRTAEALSHNVPRFRKLVWAHYKTHGRRDLPWRKTKDPYRILVSEMMLQQTQVERVIPFYKEFIKKFPTPGRLASASLATVLREWQGLGYNRRAKMLHSAAKELQNISFSSYRTKLIDDEIVGKLEELPGVGPYTARAIAAFAFNQSVIVIETNIRTAIIHHFFRAKKRAASNMIYHMSIRDEEIANILKRTLPKGRAREWYSALMDYGAYLKRSGVSLNAQSAHYMKQSGFAGSLREARGAILRTLAEKKTSSADLITLFGASRRAQVREALKALCAEGLILSQKGRYSLAD